MLPADLPAIVPLAEQLGYRNTLDTIIERFQFLGENECTALFVGEIADRIVAFMQVHETTTLMTGQRAELNAVVIEESLRGKGYGKQMIYAAEDWAKQRGLPKLRLGSQTSRTDAHEFYKKFGFNIEKTWFVFSKSLE